MKVVKQGTKPPEYSWMGKALCPYCDSVFELTAEDKSAVIRWVDDQRDGISVLVRCPVCEENRWLMHQWIGK